MTWHTFRTRNILWREIQYYAYTHRMHPSRHLIEISALLTRPYAVRLAASFSSETHFPSTYKHTCTHSVIWRLHLILARGDYGVAAEVICPPPNLFIYSLSLFHFTTRRPESKFGPFWRENALTLRYKYCLAVKMFFYSFL